jgi:hypothetical protein
MFILYAVLAGLIIGALSGGSPTRLGRLHIAWAPLIALGLGLQVVLFSTSVGNALGPLAPVVYVVSQIVVLAAVWMNRAIPGMLVVFVGGAANLAAIAANGGYMPADPDALATLGLPPTDRYTHSLVFDSVALLPLTDLFAMPAWLPLASIFSIGDVLIGVGVAIVVVAAMHGRGPVRPGTDPASARRPVLPADGPAQGHPAP